MVRTQTHKRTFDSKHESKRLPTDTREKLFQNKLLSLREQIINNLCSYVNNHFTSVSKAKCNKINIIQLNIDCTIKYNLLTKYYIEKV